MGKRTGFKVRHDRDYSMLQYYQKELDRELMNNPRNESRVKRLKSIIKSNEKKIDARKTIHHSIFGGPYTTYEQ